MITFMHAKIMKYLNLRNEAEEPIYWDPENNTKDNYEQLAQKKYQIMIDCSLVICIVFIIAITCVCTL